MFKKAAFTKYRQRLENTLTPIWNRFQPNLLSNLPQLPWSQIDGAAHFLEHHIKPKIDEYLHGLLNAMKSYDGESNGPVSKLADEINQELESESKSTGTCKDEDYKPDSPPPPSSGAPAVADQIVDANDINAICIKHSVMWRQIGLKLGLHASVLDNIQADYHEQRKCFEVTLSKWMKLAGNNATRGVLELAITNANHEDLSLEARSELKQIDYGMVKWKKFLFRIGLIEDRVRHFSTNGFGFFGRLKLSDKPSDVLVTTYHLLNDKKVAENSAILLKVNDVRSARIELKDVLRKDYSFWQSQEDKLNFTIVEIDMSKIKERLEELKAGMVIIEPLDLDPNNLTSIDKLDEIGIIDQSNGLYFKSASCCVCECLLVYSRRRTEDGYSGSPILKVVNGEIKIVGIAQGKLIDEVYVGSIISDVLKSVQGESYKEKPSDIEIRQALERSGIGKK
ncbi:uncharacterized protein [Dysidea avara]|uniref:uncharacterized protein isoform X2 n=1 Tax=Dysidea avara TaxID=196820 RepID=UPI003324AAFC